MLLTVLAFVLLAAFPPMATAAEMKVVALDITPGRVKDLEWTLDDVKSALENLSCTVKEITNLTSMSLMGVDALIIGKQYDYNSTYSADEVTAIMTWFNEGGKFLWVGADSDYVEPYLNASDVSFKSEEGNKILESIDSALRIAASSLEDPGSMVGAPYRPKSNQSNSDGWAGEITMNAPDVLFHGPTYIVGYNGTNRVPIDDVVSDTVIWLYKSSPNGTDVSHDGVDPMAYPLGYVGVLCQAAAQKMIVDTTATTKTYSKVIVTGESVLGDRHVLTTEYHDEPLDGLTFFNQAMMWGLEVERQFYLTVTSDNGEVQGAGWYMEGESATFSVSPTTVGTIIQQVFQGWSGDSTATTASASVAMDSAKTVVAVWANDYTQLIIVLGVLVVVIIVGGYFLRKK
jgi:hypothetical protein